MSWDYNFNVLKKPLFLRIRYYSRSFETLIDRFLSSFSIILCEKNQFLINLPLRAIKVVLPSVEETIDTDNKILTVDFQAYKSYEYFI